MSFFPSPDPAKLRAAARENYTFYRTPPTPSQPDPGPADAFGSGDWSGPNEPAQHAFPTSEPTSWPSDMSRGLGLQSSHLSGAPLYPTPVSTAGTMAWPSTFAHNHSTSPHTDMVRKDSTLDYCDPLSTFLPVSAAWNPFHTSASTSLPIYETSPGRSEYSTSSQASLINSSPYATSEGAFRTSGSPFIKLEEPVDAGRPRLHSHPGVMPFEHSLLVNPGDIYSSPPLSAVEQKVAGALMPAMKFENDDAYSMYGPRPCTYRSHSLQDTRAESLEDRHKRAYTTHANSTCSCDKCGKLFQRSYNLKAHMETHDPHRDQPHVCQYVKCQRRFVRRTDLLRHEQSVHLKARNYPCPLCDSSFARKDTLRRHIDDGCPRRPEVRKSVARDRRKSNASAARHNTFPLVVNVPSMNP